MKSRPDPDCSDEASLIQKITRARQNLPPSSNVNRSRHGECGGGIPLNNLGEKATEPNARQNARATITEALIESGYRSLDAQARALGLSRSTAWTVIKHKHKLGRLHMNTAMKMLAHPALPVRVRAAVEAYVSSRIQAPSPAAFLASPKAQRDAAHPDRPRLLPKLKGLRAKGNNPSQ